jgi:hypothetical protein
MSALKHAVDSVGGPQKAAEICGVTRRYIYKMLKREALPRTEYTGESHYAEKLAAASEAGDQPFAAQWLLEKARPKTV